MRSPAAAGAAAAETTGTPADLRSHKHLLLITYRRNGDAVPSPVWFGADDSGIVYCRSAADNGKVKRIRNNPTVRVAPCDRRGAPLGAPFSATARVLPHDQEAAAERAIRANFGIGRRMYKRLLGDAVPAAYIAIIPT